MYWQLHNARKAEAVHSRKEGTEDNDGEETETWLVYKCLL